MGPEHYNHPLLVFSIVRLQKILFYFLESFGSPSPLMYINHNIENILREKKQSAFMAQFWDTYLYQNLGHPISKCMSSVMQCLNTCWFLWRSTAVLFSGPYTTSASFYALKYRNIPKEKVAAEYLLSSQPSFLWNVGLSL